MVQDLLLLGWMKINLTENRFTGRGPSKSWHLLEMGREVYTGGLGCGY